MAGRNCPQCNYLISDQDIICPSCGVNLEEQRPFQEPQLSLLNLSQLRALFKQGKSNKEILASLSGEERREAYIFADLNGGKFPWEVSLDNEPPEMPEMTIIFPDDEKTTQKKKKPSQSSSVRAANDTTPKGPKPAPYVPPTPKSTPITTPISPPPQPKPIKQKKEKVSVLLFLFSLFMPLVGIFYFFSAKFYRPRKAKCALAGGVLGVVACAAITVLIELNYIPEEIYTQVFGSILKLFSS